MARYRRSLHFASLGRKTSTSTSTLTTPFKPTEGFEWATHHFFHPQWVGGSAHDSSGRDDAVVTRPRMRPSVKRGAGSKPIKQPSKGNPEERSGFTGCEKLAVLKGTALSLREYSASYQGLTLVSPPSNQNIVWAFSPCQANSRSAGDFLKGTGFSPSVTCFKTCTALAAEGRCLPTTSF